jgi:hypothetical protein
MNLKNRNAMQHYLNYLSNTHLLFWAVLALVVSVMLIIYFKAFTAGLREIFSEKNADGSLGKLSSKRIGIMAFAVTIIYVFIYSTHTGKEIDHVAFAMLTVAVIIGWRISTPEQIGSLMDKFKGFMKPDTKPETNE